MSTVTLLDRLRIHMVLKLSLLMVSVPVQGACPGLPVRLLFDTDSDFRALSPGPGSAGDVCTSPRRSVCVRYPLPGNRNLPAIAATGYPNWLLGNRDGGSGRKRNTRPPRRYQRWRAS